MRDKKSFHEIRGLSDSEEDRFRLSKSRNFIVERLLIRLKKFIFVFLPRSRMKSGTPKYPTTQDVFKASINVLTELDVNYIIYFRIRRRNWWAIVEWDKMSVELSEGNYLVRIKFPSQNSPKRIFEENKNRITEGWTIEKLGRRWVKLFVQRDHKDTIAPFLNSFYENFYGELENYHLIGDIEPTIEASR